MSYFEAGSRLFSCYDRCFSEVPGKPRSLALTDVNENLATLTWLEPTYDGNTALTHYQVEKWSVGQQQWTVVKTVMADEQLQLTDRSVEKGNSYRYRVRAANKVGLSEVDDSEDLEIHIKPNSRKKTTRLTHLENLVIISL